MCMCFFAVCIFTVSLDKHTIIYFFFIDRNISTQIFVPVSSLYVSKCTRTYQTFYILFIIKLTATFHFDPLLQSIGSVWNAAEITETIKMSCPTSSCLNTSDKPCMTLPPTPVRFTVSRFTHTFKSHARHYVNTCQCIHVLHKLLQALSANPV